MSYAKARAENLDTLTNNKVGGAELDIATARALQALARSVSSIDVDFCNIPFSEAETERAESQRDSYLMQAARLVRPFGWRVYHQSDPRGWSMYLYRQSDVDAYQSRERERNAKNGEPDRWIGGIDSIYSSYGVGVCSR